MGPVSFIQGVRMKQFVFETVILGSALGSIIWEVKLAVCMVRGHGYSLVFQTLVKAWNDQTNTNLSLRGPVGQLYALVVGNDILFAGTQDGRILAWRFNISGNCFDKTAPLTGHHLAVVSLSVGGYRLTLAPWTIV